MAAYEDYCMYCDEMVLNRIRWWVCAECDRITLFSKPETLDVDSRGEPTDKTSP